MILISCLFIPKVAIDELIRLEAIGSDSESFLILTQLGEKMSKIPLDPRLSKMILSSNDAGNGEKALILASLCSMAGNVFFRQVHEQE